MRIGLVLTVDGVLEELDGRRAVFRLAVEALLENRHDRLGARCCDRCGVLRELLRSGTAKACFTYIYRVLEFEAWGFTRRDNVGILRVGSDGEAEGTSGVRFRRGND